jgi:hypothetical protein
VTNFSQGKLFWDVAHLKKEFIIILSGKSATGTGIIDRLPVCFGFRNTITFPFRYLKCTTGTVPGSISDPDPHSIRIRWPPGSGSGSMCREMWLRAGKCGSCAGRCGFVPGDVARCREMWLSPVIQATWEARAVGWFEVERSISGNGWSFRAALRLPTD